MEAVQSELKLKKKIMTTQQLLLVRSTAIMLRNAVT